MKHWYKSKTVIFAVLTILLGALQAAGTLKFDSTTDGYIMVAIGIVIKLLRWFTNSSIK